MDDYDIPRPVIIRALSELICFLNIDIIFGIFLLCILIMEHQDSGVFSVKSLTIMHGRLCRS